MARAADLRSRETLRLAANLGVPVYAAVGLRELLFGAAFQKADPHLGDALDVELVAGWDGDRGRFVTAAVSAGLIADLGDGSYVALGFEEAAPRWVDQRRARAEKRRALGKTLSELRADAGRKGAAARDGKQEASGERLPTSGRQVADPSSPPSLPPTYLPAPGECEGGSRPPATPRRFPSEQSPESPKNGTRRDRTTSRDSRRARALVGAHTPSKVSEPDETDAERLPAPPPPPDGEANVWTKLLPEIAALIDDERSVETWLRPVRQAGPVDGTLSLVAPTLAAARVLRDDYMTQIADAGRHHGINVPIRFFAEDGREVA